MPETLAKVIPFLIKLTALIVGGILSLVFSGDINLDKDNNASLTINKKVILKLVLAIAVGLFIGDFMVIRFNYDSMNYYAKAIFYLLSSMFGMLALGTLYRGWQLQTKDKTLSEIVAEIKSITKALIK